MKYCTTEQQNKKKHALSGVSRLKNLLELARYRRQSMHDFSRGSGANSGGKLSLGT